MFIKLPTVLHVFGVLALGVWLAVESSAGQASEPNQREAGAGMLVAVHNDRLDFHARDVPLVEALHEIAVEGGFVLEVHGRLSGTVTRSVKSLALTSALRSLLDENSFVMLFASGNNDIATARLRKLIVYGDHSASHSNSTMEYIEQEAAGQTENAPSPTRAKRIAKLREIRHLSHDQPEDAIRKLSGLMLNDEDPLVREAAANILTRFRGDTVTDALLYSLTDLEASVRRRAIVALGRINDHQAILPLTDILRWDADRESRILAAKSLGTYYGRATLEALAEASNDPDTRVREAATATLTRLRRTH